MSNDDSFFINKCLGVLSPEERDEFNHILETEHRDEEEIREDALDALMSDIQEPMSLEEFEAALLKWAKEGNEDKVPTDKAWEQIENIVKESILLKNKEDQK